jgi:hypothetical protein
VPTFTCTSASPPRSFTGVNSGSST